MTAVSGSHQDLNPRYCSAVGHEFTFNRKADYLPGRFSNASSLLVLETSLEAVDTHTDERRNCITKIDDWTATQDYDSAKPAKEGWREGSIGRKPIVSHAFHGTEECQNWREANMLAVYLATAWIFNRHLATLHSHCAYYRFGAIEK